MRFPVLLLVKWALCHVCHVLFTFCHFQGHSVPLPGPIECFSWRWMFLARNIRKTGVALFSTTLVTSSAVQLQFCNFPTRVTRVRSDRVRGWQSEGGISPLVSDHICCNSILLPWYREFSSFCIYHFSKQRNSWNASIKWTSTRKGKPLASGNCCWNGILPKSVSTPLPPLKEMDVLWQFFSQKFSHFFGNGYFDNDNGQTLFLNGIHMDVRVDNGEI